ncbi:hypothetical protein QFZ63_001632 [Streptomyces sp. B3I7]|uniref:hypothetical protein n=1 Tax=Streptomyces sp. B3I7 TaxID=3042269 RepID=UPI002783E7CB|nr:hypothetical protein [Streptomyces sp. B3I7]MDQ0809918.1 hypothetical protein [Streptomyces sp. B3I7]
MKPSSQTQEREIAARFARDTAAHRMTVLHDDGLYRHLRFAAPERGSVGPFDLITWPYNLVVKAGWTFHFDIDATPDMFNLFRKTAFSGEINPGYWSEKVRAGRDEIEGYNPNLFEEQVKQHVVDAIRGGDAPRGIGAEVTRDIFEWGDISHEAGARKELEDFRYQDWTFGETWEWNFCDFTPGFLHCCHAIRRGIDLWDAAREQAEVAA